MSINFENGGRVITAQAAARPTDLHAVNRVRLTCDTDCMVLNTLGLDIGER